MEPGIGIHEPSEFFWGCELNKEKPVKEWQFVEEDDDSDYLVHTLFLKHACLGASAVQGERNIISIETTNFDKEPISQPLFSLTLGQNDWCYSDLSFTQQTPVKFKLTEGSGPVFMSAQELVEIPEDPNLSQETGYTDDEELDEIEEDGDSPKKDLKVTTKKRKASTQKGKGKQRGKFADADDEEEDEDEEEEDEDMEEDEEDEDEEEDDEEEEDSEESPVKPKKKAAAKTKAQRKVEVKKDKVSKQKAVKKVGKKK